MDNVRDIVLFVSLFLSILAIIVSDKPYYKKLYLVEDLQLSNTQIRLIVYNIGREGIYIKCVELRTIKNNTLVGHCYLTHNGNKQYALKPGDVLRVEIDLFPGRYLDNTKNLNELYKAVVCEMNGKKSEHKNIFALG
ncbi:MAG: hypothetical protein IKZ29_07110 [Clostridiales bacterium]|nr:hypothetical protein [Clostridiales bacterium]